MLCYQLVTDIIMLAEISLGNIANTHKVSDMTIASTDTEENLHVPSDT